MPMLSLYKYPRMCAVNDEIFNKYGELTMSVCSLNNAVKHHLSSFDKPTTLEKKNKKNKRRRLGE